MRMVEGPHQRKTVTGRNRKTGIRLVRRQGHGRHTHRTVGGCSRTAVTRPPVGRRDPVTERFVRPDQPQGSHQPPAGTAEIALEKHAERIGQKTRLHVGIPYVENGNDPLSALPERHEPTHEGLQHAETVRDPVRRRIDEPLRDGRHLHPGERFRGLRPDSRPRNRNEAPRQDGHHRMTHYPIHIHCRLHSKHPGYRPRKGHARPNPAGAVPLPACAAAAPPSA